MWTDYEAELPEDNPGYHEQLWRLLEAQDGQCGICDADISSQRCGVLDHDHKTGRTRGLLCYSCNISLGMSGATNTRRRQYLAHPPAEKLGWYYVTAFGEVPERAGDHVMDMEKARAAIEGLSFDRGCAG